MSVAVPEQRTHRDPRHWCLACEECPSCEGGALALPLAWSVDVLDTGRVVAVCAVCHNARTICPTTTTQEAPL